MEVLEIESYTAEVRSGSPLRKGVTAYGSDVGNDVANVLISRDDLLHLGHQSVRCIEVGSLRGFYEYVGTPGLDVGEELSALAEEGKGADGTHEEDEGNEYDGQAVVQCPVEKPQVDAFDQWQSPRIVAFRPLGWNRLVASGEHRVDDQGHEEGGTEGAYQGYGEEVHELAHDPRPEEHREEGPQRGEG